MSMVIGTYREISVFKAAALWQPNAEPDRVLIKFHGSEVVLRRGADGIWSDEHGTWYALRRDADSLDDVDRCGVYPFVVPFETPLDPGCTVHDYMYSSPVYQLFHTRRQADDYMLQLQLRNKPNRFWRSVARLFHRIARAKGSKYWENRATDV